MFADKSAQEIADWVLEAADDTGTALSRHLDALDRLRALGDSQTLRECYGLLEEALIARGAGADLRGLLAWRCGIGSEHAPTREHCHAVLAKTFPQRLETAFVESVGFDDAALAPAECLRRVSVLLALGRDSCCIDRTWGFGVVKRIDDFYRKIQIDFTGKPGHAMSFAYAGEALRPVGDDHLLALRYRRKPEFVGLRDREPHTLIRLALRDFGPLTVTQLQELFTTDVLDGRDWKGFWDSARKGLKADPLVDIPAKRSEPIRLLDREKDYAGAWLAGFSGQRDARAILDGLLELEREGAAVEGNGRAVLADRAAFGFLGAEDREPELATRILLAADRLGLADAGFDVGEHARRLGKPAGLRAGAGLSARDLVPWLRLMTEHVPDIMERLEALLGELPAAAVALFIDAWRGAEREEHIADIVRERFNQRTLPGEVLLYLGGHADLLGAWRLGPMNDLLDQVVSALEAEQSGDRYRTQKLLREQFENHAWVEQVLDLLSAPERSRFLTRLRESRGWDAASRRSLMGRIIKRHPELEVVVAREEKHAETPAMRHTSWRSYRERQAQFRKLIEVTIPENSKEIAHARSYGDLRENFEYQSAKDQQRLLLQRQADIERDLRDVHGSDFAGVPTTSVGMGTGVRLRLAGGETALYWVLGEWDRDEALGIISNKSELAVRLEGRVVGERVELPGEEGGASAEIEAVLPLDDAIRAWVRGDA